MGDLIEDLTSFIAGEGLEQFKERMAPSKSGKSKVAIRASQEGVVLPSSLWRVDKGRSVSDPSGGALPKVSSGAGFIDEVLDNDLTIWTEIITEWGNNRSDISDITST